MLDKLIKHYQSPQQTISNDDFHAWKHNPVTQQFFKDIASSYLDEVNGAQHAVRPEFLAGRLQGVRELTETIIDWHPNEEED